METTQKVKKPSPKKVIELDGVNISAVLFKNPGNITGVVIPRAERNRIKEDADFHWVGGKLLAVTEARILADASMMILGKFTENPTPYFLEEWEL